MEIYFDNSATTPCHREVAELMFKISTEEFGNPSSMHHAGVVAENHIKGALAAIAGTLKARPDEIIFTSGGTEADNLAIIGTALALRRRGKHIITTRVEHPAVLKTVGFLEKEGFEVTYLGVDGRGLISVDELRASLRDDTILVSVMHTNNEVGALMPIEEAALVIREHNSRKDRGSNCPETLFHVDAVQGYGKHRIFPQKLGIDLMSVSGHKIHGPKGIGFLYKRSGVRIVPTLYGGGQQKDLRPGTENVAGIAGLGLAAGMACKDIEGDMSRIFAVSDLLKNEISSLPDCYINSPEGDEWSPHIINASFVGIRSEVMLHALEDKGIYVSSGSACASNKRESFSDTLQAMGFEKERMDSAIRFSLSHLNTVEEAAFTLKAIKELLPLLRRYRQR